MIYVFQHASNVGTGIAVVNLGCFAPARFARSLANGPGSTQTAAMLAAQVVTGAESRISPFAPSASKSIHPKARREHFIATLARESFMIAGRLCRKGLQGTSVAPEDDRRQGFALGIQDRYWHRRQTVQSDPFGKATMACRTV